MLIGARFPNTGPLAGEVGFSELARRLEDAGFDSLWVSDHLLMPARAVGTYPFSDDGRMAWDAEMEWHDPLVALAVAAGATRRIALGTAVLVALLRHPIVVAKQVATLEQAAPGRLRLGVGAGWLREEFEALGVPFAGRGRRLDAWIERVRSCWAGDPGTDLEGPYPLPDKVRFRPAVTPAPPVLVGGTSMAALQRAGAVADGWLGIQRADRLEPEAVAAQVAAVRAAAAHAGRDPARVRVTVQVIGSEGRAERIAPFLPAFAAAGVQELIVDPGWDDLEQPRRTHRALEAHLTQGADR